MSAGHGDYSRILEYTMPQIEGALAAIDRRERRERLTNIFNYRIAQADSKGFKEAVKRLETEDKAQRIREARRKGLKAPVGQRSEKEERVLAAQGHAAFWELPEHQRTALEREQAAAWATIPAEFRAKAEKLTRGRA